jgi:hypothetical protein
MLLYEHGESFQGSDLNEAIGDGKVHAKNGFEVRKKVTVQFTKSNGADGAKFLAGIDMNHPPS